MKNLADSERLIAVVFEVLRQCYRVWYRLTKMSVIVPDANRVGTPPRQHGKSRRATNRLLTIGSVKQRAVGS